MTARNDYGRGTLIPPCHDLHLTPPFAEQLSVAFRETTFAGTDLSDMRHCAI
jgi:hypothetical protein